jgi:hypothetical protein
MIFKIKKFLKKLFKKGEPDEHSQHWGIGA